MKTTFQSTPSTRRETIRADVVGVCYDISIHSLHTEGDFFEIIDRGALDISIHSLHTEGDIMLISIIPQLSNFNPLPPHGGRLMGLGKTFTGSEFQSTPSTRRETKRIRERISGLSFQSTPSTRRETPDRSKQIQALEISIHSLHTEGDAYLSWLST